MTRESALHEIPGGQALIDWFGRAPQFHDANLLEINLFSQAPSTLRIHTWRTTQNVDAEGHLILEKHVVVTITLGAVTSVSLRNFDRPGIILDLEITKAGDAIRIEWDGSYGVVGSLQAKTARIDFTPGSP